MEALNKEYQDELDKIVKAVQAAPELAKYLDDEEEETYNELKNIHEPHIAVLYQKIAENNPLQLVAFEEACLVPELEALFLPKALGYSVLRGYINDDYKYILPQEHFKKIILEICNSSNFEILQNRIGQTLEVGFSLSSDIWTTNLINSFANKTIKNYLLSHKLLKYRNERSRGILYRRYKAQFKAENFLSAEFPTKANELKIKYPGLRQFLDYRISDEHNNESLIPHITSFVENENLTGHEEHLELMILAAGFFNISSETTKYIKEKLTTLRKDSGFNDQYFGLLLKYYESKINTDKSFDLKVSEVIDKSINDKIGLYYNLMEEIHAKGYVHNDAVSAMDKFYSQNKGMSITNECARAVIHKNFSHFIRNLDEDSYTSFFDITKYFTPYMSVFNNAEFNHKLRSESVRYVKKLLRRYTDKRGRDYQDIKKFVNVLFEELGFMTQKELKEFFKTKRKKKAVPA